MGFAEASAAGTRGPRRAMASILAPTLGPMKRPRILCRFDRRPGWIPRGAVAALALAAGAILGPDGGGEAGAAFIALGVVALVEGLRPGPHASGGRGGDERGVSGGLGAELIALERRGWLVAQAVSTGPAGEIDYLVTAPSVSFLIDVASSGTERSAAIRLEAHAEWARQVYGPDRRLEPILCRSGPSPGGTTGAREVAPRELINYLLDRG